MYNLILISGNTFVGKRRIKAVSKQVQLECNRGDSHYNVVVILSYGCTWNV